MAVALGAVVALPFGPERQISVDLWIVATAGWLLIALVAQLSKVAPVTPPSLRAPWRRRPEPEERSVQVPRELTTLGGTILRATDTPRMFGLQLRPRLQRVVDHGLMSRHGIDAELAPERAARTLGDLAWMVDPEVDDRSPTVAEIEELLDRVLPVGPSSAEEAIR
jgi:hypothetical protein